MTHLYRAQEGPPAPENMDARDYFPWCLDQIENGRFVRVQDTAKAPAEAIRDLEVWSHFGVKAVLGVPLSTGGGPVVGESPVILEVLKQVEQADGGVTRREFDCRAVDGAAAGISLQPLV